MTVHDCCAYLPHVQFLAVDEALVLLADRPSFDLTATNHKAQERVVRGVGCRRSEGKRCKHGGEERRDVGVWVGEGRRDVGVWVGEGRRDVCVVGKMCVWWGGEERCVCVWEGEERCVWWKGEGVVCASAACDLRYMVINCRGFSSQLPQVCPYSRFTPGGVGFHLLKLNCGSVPNESSTRNKHLKDVNGYINLFCLFTIISLFTIKQCSLCSELKEKQNAN